MTVFLQKLSYLIQVCIAIAESNSNSCRKKDYANSWWSSATAPTVCFPFENNELFSSNLNCCLTFETWKFPSSTLLADIFPLDKERRNFVRTVSGAIFSVVLPRPLSKERTLAAFTEDVLTEILNLDHSAVTDLNFLAFVSGSKVHEKSTPLAHRYGGHQFGYWAGQLGDGRAHLLGEHVSSSGERWELQLKGSGTTPYSRRGDGYAVIRSSVREFLASEAMNHLGISFKFDSVFFYV